MRREKEEKEKISKEEIKETSGSFFFY